MAGKGQQQATEMSIALVLTVLGCQMRTEEPQNTAVAPAVVSSTWLFQSIAGTDFTVTHHSLHKSSVQLC